LKFGTAIVNHRNGDTFIGDVTVSDRTNVVILERAYRINFPIDPKKAPQGEQISINFEKIGKVIINKEFWDMVLEPNSQLVQTYNRIEVGKLTERPLPSVGRTQTGHIKTLKDKPLASIPSSITSEAVKIPDPEAQSELKTVEEQK
jgi:hypothetical protein